MSIVDMILNLASTHPYLLSFVLGLLGSVGVIVSFTPSLFLFAALVSSGANPVLASILAGLGAAIGEFSAYLLGYLGKIVIDLSGKTVSMPENLRNFLSWLDNVLDEYADVTVFVFTLTPLPDDILFAYLGTKRYPVTKIILPAFLGKTSLHLFVAYSAGILIFQIILAPVLIGFEGLLGYVIIAIAGVVFYYAISKIDLSGPSLKWVKRLKKYKGYLKAVVIFIIALILKLLSRDTEE